MSRLYERMAQPCTRVAEGLAPDGEGGCARSLEPGAAFSAVLTRSSSTSRDVGGRPEEGAAYDVLTDEPLAFGDLFRRDADGALFRATSTAAECAAPACATFSFMKLAAERWRPGDGD